MGVRTDAPVWVDTSVGRCRSVASPPCLLSATEPICRAASLTRPGGHSPAGAHHTTAVTGAGRSDTTHTMHRAEARHERAHPADRSASGYRMTGECSSALLALSACTTRVLLIDLHRCRGMGTIPAHTGCSETSGTRAAHRSLASPDSSRHTTTYTSLHQCRHHLQPILMLPDTRSGVAQVEMGATHGLTAVRSAPVAAGMPVGQPSGTVPTQTTRPSTPGRSPTHTPATSTGPQ